MNTMIKIAISPSYGSTVIPEEYFGRIDYDVQGRIELAKKIEELPVSVDNVDELIDRDKTLDYFRAKYDDVDSLFYRSEFGYYDRFIIVEVDTSKPWRISEYDGSESIEYFEGVEVVDDKYNLCSW